MRVAVESTIDLLGLHHMTPFQIIAAQKALLSKCEKDTDHNKLKADALGLNKRYAEYVNGGRPVTPFEKRQVKKYMCRLFSGLERVDFERTSNKFEFMGRPEPPAINMSRQKVDLSEEAPTMNNISGKNDEILPIGAEHAKMHVYIEDLTGSSVWGLRNSENLPYSVHIENLKKCKILLRCDGPIILHGVEDSVLILDCHQLRIHNMRRCHVLANVTNSRVIIEKSEELVFCGISGKRACAPLYVVDDFDWPTSEVQNPHYEMMNIVDDEAKKLMREWVEKCGEND